MIRTASRLVLVASVAAVLSGMAAAQDDCVSPAFNRPVEPSTFSLKQELALGDVVARHLAVSGSVIKDPQITSRLEQISSRLAQYLPDYAPKPKVRLIDDPDANAYNVAGGYVYVTRKLIAATRSEDELAAVLAHEFGHLVQRHAAVTQSRLFKTVLGISALEPNANIAALYNKVYDTYMKDPAALRRALPDTADQEQDTADAISVYLMARAGYSPQAFVDFFDRFAETKGKAGNWLSDMFGITKPDAKRLRNAIAAKAALPASCTDSASRAPTGDYLAWRDAVVAYVPKRTESLHGVVSQTRLVPPMRGEIREVRFSPDGKHVLATDADNVYVVQHEPMKFEFRIDAPGVASALFTPDSQAVVLYTNTARVEKWSIAEQKRISVSEMIMRHPCFQTALAPDGSVMACLQAGDKGVFPLTLALLDVATGEPVFTRKEFFELKYADFGNMREELRVYGEFSIADMAFSPDGKYFLAGGWSSHVCIDLKTRTELKLPAPILKLMRSHFAFMGPDRLVGLNRDNPGKSAIVHFPDGAVQLEFTLGLQRVYGPAKGDFVILRPLSHNPVGVVDPKLNKIVLAKREQALDVYGNDYVGPLAPGYLGLYRVGDYDPVVSAELPLGPVGPIYALSLDEERKRMAISGRLSGAIYNMQQGTRTHQLNAFRGVWLNNDSLYLTYAPPEARAFGQELRSLAQLKEKVGLTVNRVDLKTGDSEQLVRFSAADQVDQVGPYLLITTPKDEKDSSKGLVLEVRDLRSNTTAWKRECLEPLWIPAFDPGSDSIVLLWYLDGKDAASQIMADPDLKRRVAAIAHKDASWLVEVADLHSGKVKVHFPLDTGNRSIHIDSVRYSQSALLVTGADDRVHIYSSDGEPRTTVFGRHVSLSPDGKLLALEAEPGTLAVYDFARMEKKDEYVFSKPLAFSAFAQGSQRLLVMTDDQIVHALDVSGADNASTGK